MIEETQTIQGQTSQPAPQTQTPQSTNSTVQQTVNQQTLESGTGSIRVPGAGEQSTVEATRSTPSSSTSNNAGFSIETGLLIVAFVLAVSFIFLLARMAITATPPENQNDA